MRRDAMRRDGGIVTARRGSGFFDPGHAGAVY